MYKRHTKNTVRYYLLLVVALLFLFFSGDFGLTDVQKTAIVMAVGVDREEETFIVTSQIAIPQSSKQGKASETVQIVSRGKTIAAAFEDINAKTGWYPKLVFCRLILLGEKAVEQNVFDALDFFLLDEYMSDNCLLATCDGTAKDMLNITALVDPSGSVAIQKVLSTHAQRVGTVLPTTLREFAVGYFSDSKSSYLPLLKTRPQQEQIGSSDGSGGSQSGEQGGSSGGTGGSGGAGGGNSNGGANAGGESSGGSSSEGGSQGGSGSSGGSGSGSESSGSSGGESSGGAGGAGGGGSPQDKPVFSAGETALFVEGKKVGTLTREETFAFNAVKKDLKLAAYSVEHGGGTCTLSIKHNTPKTEFSLGKDGRATMKITVTLTAGLLDYSKALPLEEGKDSGDVPNGVFEAAEKRLSSQIQTAFEKCRSCGCDIFELKSALHKKNKDLEGANSAALLQNALAEIDVVFQGVR